MQRGREIYPCGTLLRQKMGGLMEILFNITQSGDPYNRHYDDLLKRWQRVRYLPMRYDCKTVDGATHERLELEP